MTYVQNVGDIEDNAFVLLDTALSHGESRGGALKLIKGGRVFYPIQYNDTLAFVPSKFIGYRGNTVSNHQRLKRDEGRDGRETNRALDKIIGRSFADAELELRFIQFCHWIGVEPENHKRRFWRLETARRFIAPAGSAINDVANVDVGNDDPEYRLRMAGTYVRDPSVRTAVLNRASGKCEFCGEEGFKTKGGAKFLESHHIISLSEQGADKLTNVIALCPNHHRRAHFGEDWENLQKEFLKILRDLAR